MSEEPRGLDSVEEETRLVIAPDGELTKHESPEELAAKIVTVLDIIAERLQLESPHPKTARKVRGARTVSPEFVFSLLAMVEVFPVLQSFNLIDPAEAREVLQSRDSLRIITEDATRFLAKLNYTTEARWAGVVKKAMAVYHMAIALAEDPEHADLAAHVKTLRRHLARTSNTKKKKPSGK